MKKIFIVLFVFASAGMWAQTSVSKQEAIIPQNPSANPPNARSLESSIKVESSAPIVKPYDEKDMYMGRKNEFLNSMIVKELPADFPKYQKEWSVKDYNLVVDAYYMSHLDILKEKPKEKILRLKQQQ